jgi:hypothetical protein
MSPILSVKSIAIKSKVVISIVVVFMMLQFNLHKCKGLFAHMHKLKNDTI